MCGLTNNFLTGLVQSRTQQKSFLYLLEEKRGGARKSKIEKKTFLLAGERRRGGAIKYKI